MPSVEEKFRNIPPKSVVLVETPIEENQIRLLADYLKARRDDKGYQKQN
jgi:hypothetical protein